MAEERKGIKVKKWDEVQGSFDGEVVPVLNDVGTDNRMHNIEEMIEQNDNQLDGIINNLPMETVFEKEAKTSVREKLKVQIPESDHKVMSLCSDWELC